MTTTSPTLLVLAAGLGARYEGLKQIDPVGPNDETILDYSIYDAIRAGFGKVVFVIRKDIEQSFRKRLGARFEGHIAVEYVFQELDKLPASWSVPVGRTKPWGTMQAVLMGADVIREAFAVINADDFYGRESYRMLTQHLRSCTPDYAMVGFVLRNTLSDFGTVSRGLCNVDACNLLQNIVELTTIEANGSHATNIDANGGTTMLTGDEVVSMNMWGFSPSIFGLLKERFRSFLERSGSDARAEGYLPSAINDLILAGRARVKVLSTNDTWFGITYREDRPRVVDSIGRLIEAGCYPQRLWL